MTLRANFAGFLLPALVLTTVATADELPQRKPGLWESTGTVAGQPSNVKQCIDAKTDQLAQSAAMPNATCSKRDITKTAAGYKTETLCTIGGITAEASGLISGDFTDTVKIDITTKLSGLPGGAGGMPPQVMSITSKRVGDCAAGQKPGDIVLPDGRTIRTPGSPG